MSVVGRRALYKEAQDRFTRWLTEAAASRRQSMAPKRSPVPVKDLKACAELIVSWTPPIDIDSGMLELLQDVIIGRRLARAFFAERGMQDEGHLLMIESLVEIHSKLSEERQRRISRQREQRRQRKQTKQSEENEIKEARPEQELESKFAGPEKDILANMSDILQKDEVSDSNSTHGRPKKAGKAARATPITIEVDEAEEARFALFCALQDMSELRKRVKEIWIQQKEGKVSASAATVIAETAFALMKRTDEDLVANHPQFCHYTDALKSIGLIECFHPIDKTPAIGRVIGSCLIVESGDTNALFCPMAGALVNDFMNRWCSIEHTAQVSKLAGDNGDKYAYEHPPDIEGRYSYHPFAKLFYELFPDILQLVRSSVHWVEARLKIPDMIGGLAQVGRTKNVRLWLISTIQSNFEVTEVLESLDFENRSNILWHMRAHRSDRVFSTYTEFCFHHYNNPGVPSKMPLSMQDRLDIDLSVTNALIQNETGCKVVTLDVGESWQPLEAYRRLPLLAGGNLDSLQSVMHRYGIDVANTGHIIVSVAYLYLALKHAGCLSRDWMWRDMEWFLEEHNKERHLVQDAGPKGNMGHFVRHFMLSLGVSPVSMAKDARSHRPVMTKSRRADRVIQTGSEYLREMYEHTKMNNALNLNDQGATVTVLHKLVTAKRPVSKSSRAGSGTKLTAIDLLDEFTTMRLRDEPAFCFDYISFWMICATLVGKLNAETQEALSKSIKTIPRDGVDAMVIGDILIDASKTEARGESFKTSILSDAGKLMKSHIAEYGSQLVDEAAQLASGDIPVGWPGPSCAYSQK